MRLAFTSALAIVAGISAAACSGNANTASSGGGGQAAETGGGAQQSSTTHTTSTSSSDGGHTTAPSSSSSGSGNGSSVGSGGDASGTGGAGVGPGGSGGAGVGGSGGDITATWTAIDLVNEVASDGTNIMHKGNSLVAAIHFKDLTHGAVGLAGDQSTFQFGGAIEHMNGPANVDKIAFSGYDLTITGGQSSDFAQLYATPFGLVAGTSFQETFVVSHDDGATWTVGPLGTLGGGNGPAAQVFLGKASGGAWVVMDDVGNVWQATQDPGAATVFARTWQPEAPTPDPNPLPPADCQQSFHQGYFASDSQRVFTMSVDGKTMMYPNGLGSNAAGVCRSTDGGHNFLPVAFPNPPAAAATDEPYVVVMSSATHGFAARANDLNDGDAFVYTTDDAGATWAAGTLPPSVTAAGVDVALVSGFAAPDGQHVWLVGFSNVNEAHSLLLKSSDGGTTWTDISAQLNTVPGSDTKLHTGFALDANNIWVGGQYGALFYSPTGGE